MKRVEVRKQGHPSPTVDAWVEEQRRSLTGEARYKVDDTFGTQGGMLWPLRRTVKITLAPIRG